MRRIYEDRILQPLEGYNLAAPYYDRWYWQPFWQKNEWPVIERILQASPNTETLLDVGCGTGSYMERFGHLGSVVGIDLSHGMLKVAQSKCQNENSLICANVTALPLRREAFDAAIAARVLCHEPSLERSLRELARVVRSGGRLIISEVHGLHDYPRTRIPIANEDLYIETIKRTPREIYEGAVESGLWSRRFETEVFWNDLHWKPPVGEFERIDRSGGRPIFFIVVLSRR